MRRLSRRLDGWLFVLMLLAGAGAIGYLSTRFAVVGDWTAGGRASLSAQSRGVLAALHGPVEVVSYASPREDLRSSIAGVIERYQRAKPDLSLRFVDPQQDPGRMRELGVSVDGMLIVHYGGREVRLDRLSESSFTDALERLARGGERIVAFVTGDGERRPDGDAGADLGALMEQLQPSGMRAVPLNFSQVPAVPGHTDLVVLASPTTALAPAAVKALTDYLADGGNLLWLADPANHDLGLQPLADALGLRVLPGVLVDGGGAALGVHDPRVIAVGDYPAQTVTDHFTLTTVFPQTAALALSSTHAWQAEPLLRSGPQSWTEFQPIGNDGASTIRYDADAGELKGPLDFGFALTRLSPSPDKQQQRVVVVGDSDFLSSQFLGQGGNRVLGERIVNWLLGDDMLVRLPPRGAPDRVIEVSQARVTAVTYGFLLGLPLLLLLGGLIGWRRQRR